jgi:adenylosuccinate synthase
MPFEKLLEDVQAIAILRHQWGDTGKGKFSDHLEEFTACRGAIVSVDPGADRTIIR